MFNLNEDPKLNFLEQTKAAREERAIEKRRETAAITIQASIRGWLERVKFVRSIV